MEDLFSTKIAYASLDTFLGNVYVEIINPLIIFLFGLALVFFLYGVLEFILNQENEEAKTKGKSHMMWGIIGLVIMMGVWTILGMIINTFDLKGIDVENGNIEVDLNP
ncbi:hypothetical protein HYW73_02660 [Candidatus Nomurabacteria bacterium]|nr:hypothetical protein [Candidatus Nomurabacteria bacterium]